jgi:hypothetical protein
VHPSDEHPWDVLDVVLGHAAWRCDEAGDAFSAGHTHEAARALGMAQGLLWSIGVTTLQDLLDAANDVRARPPH